MSFLTGAIRTAAVSTSARATLLGRVAPVVAAQQGKFFIDFLGFASSDRALIASDPSETCDVEALKGHSRRSLNLASTASAAIQHREQQYNSSRSSISCNPSNEPGMKYSL